MKKIRFIRLIIITVISGIIFLQPGMLSAQTDDGTLLIRKCKDFEVTGTGSTDQWNSAEWVNLVQQRSDYPGYQTKAKVLYSDTGIYFLFNCADEKLTSTMAADNLDLWTEDVVEVFLWTDETFPVYFEYELSPMNYELPIMVPNYKGNFLGWLPWHYDGDRRTRHATSVTGGEKKSGSSVSAWIAEIFIPYKLLTPLNKVPPVSGTKWRANMYRIDHDHDRLSFVWNKVTTNFHDYNHFGTFIFE